MKNNDFTSGAILPKLLKFMLPVLFAMFLQAMYGAVDLLVVGQFGTTEDVSAVSTGSQIITTLTNLIVSFSMGITVAVGQKIGQKRPDEASQTIGTGMIIFLIAGAVFTLISLLGASVLAQIMQAPENAFDLTANYIRICGGGFIIITAYNLLGSVFRGLGCCGYAFYAVGNCLMLIQLYFSDNKGALISGGSFAAATILLTLILRPLGIRYFGLGFALGSMLFTLVAMCLLWHYLSHLMERVLCSQPVVVRKRDGICRRIAETAEENCRKGKKAHYMVEDLPDEDEEEEE